MRQALEAKSSMSLARLARSSLPFVFFAALAILMSLDRPSWISPPAARSPAPATKLLIPPGVAVLGYIDSGNPTMDGTRELTLNDEQQLELSGWAASALPDLTVKDLAVFVGNAQAGSTGTFFSSPDVAAAYD
jgi:hypothetical protein